LAGRLYQTVWTAILAAGLLGPSLPASEQEQDVVWLGSEGGAGRTKISGRILDYNGRELQIELAGGGQQRYPSDRVLKVETQYGRDQTLAEAAFGRSEFDQAVALYRMALESEPRPWVRRQIAAGLVWSYQAVDQMQLAGETFLLLVRSDPQTPHFACIPLAWIASQPPGPLEQAARQWLGRQDLPAARLLGASHLLAPQARSAATEHLGQLTSDPDPRIALLAQAQLWRTKAATAAEPEIDLWEAAIGRMPEGLRGGPYYVLGLARAGRQQWEQASTALLRLPILYPHQRQLAARALVDAGRCLEKMGKQGESRRLYQEVIDRYPETASTAEARDCLEQAAP